MASVYVRGEQRFYGGSHIIPECAFRTGHPVCMTMSHNFTIPSDDMYLIVPISSWSVVYEISGFYNSNM